MKAAPNRPLLALLTTAAALALAAGCTNYPWLPGLGGSSQLTASSVFVRSGQTFTENLIQARTFVGGSAVTTVTYRVDDMTRTPFGIDFNADGKIDPVAAYVQDGIGVIQILLSRGAVGTVDFISLTLDGGANVWSGIKDVQVADIDGDGALDILAATQDAVVYMHHPSGQATTELRAWGNPDASLEYIDASTSDESPLDIQGLVTQTFGPGFDVADFSVTVERGYANIEIADFDGDGDNDIAAARRFNLTLQPKDESSTLPTLQVIGGNVQILVNPGFADDGDGWTAVNVGVHERHLADDRDGATGLRAYDLDADGDLDIVSAAREDTNAQVAWFENPGGVLDPFAIWTQWRVGSLRDAYAIDIADVTGDGRPDVIATGGLQQQLMLFVQPAEGPERPYDWDSFPIVTFESFEPRDVRTIDLDNDGFLEIVVGGTAGAVRYFERNINPTAEWTAAVVTTFDPPGEVGLLGWGDFDGDGDFDLIAVLDADVANDVDDRIVWIRNELISGN